MHLLAILTILLAFPITVSAQSLGPQTHQMIREYSNIHESFDESVDQDSEQTQ